MRDIVCRVHQHSTHHAAGMHVSRYKCNGDVWQESNHTGPGRTLFAMRKVSVPISVVGKPWV